MIGTVRRVLQSPVRAGAIWTPLKLGSKLVAWFVADKGVTIGTGVSAWASQSTGGISITQATGSKQPSYVSGASPSGKYALRFARSSGQYLQGAFTLAQPDGVLIACKWDRAVSGQCLCDGGATADSLDPYSASSSGNVQLYASSAGPTIAVASDTALILEAMGNGSSSFLAVNGGTKSTGSAGTASMGGFTLACAKSGSASGCANVDVYEVLVINAVLTDAERASAIAYLKARNGIA